MTHGAAFFQAACESAAELDRPTLMVAPDRSALPDELPPNVHHLTYAPFAWLFARAAVVVHHGGIGTSGRALAAGLPQLIIPRGFDQFDNAQRVTRIGAGVSIDRHRADSVVLSSSIRMLLTDASIKRCCREIMAELASSDADEETCKVVERLLR
jgi:UDP:flavonoid glycosyltransferase YjiC (YdhE family)